MRRDSVRRRSRAWGLVFLAAVLAAGWAPGCSRRPVGPVRVPVQGKLTRGGKGIGRVALGFYPNDPKIEGPFTAPTEDDGSFGLECPAGGYRVTVTPLALRGGSDPGGGGLEGGPGVSRLQDVPSLYRNAERTPMRAEVPAGGISDLVLMME